MSDAVNLDAMIRRDDFAVKGSQVASAEPIKSLSIETLNATGMLVPLLRKPDFQRENKSLESSSGRILSRELPGQ
jgi:hypothetical protein